MCLDVVWVADFCMCVYQAVEVVFAAPRAKSVQLLGLGDPVGRQAPSLQAAPLVGVGDPGSVCTCSAPGRPRWWLVEPVRL